MSSLRLLVVDDHADSVSALARLLRHAGHEVSSARSVGEALRLALADPPDVLVSDLDLTDGDGCDLLRHVRAAHPRVRGIAVSGHTGEQHEQRCRDAGYEALLPKPLDLDRLRSAVEGPARPAGASPSRPAAEMVPAPRVNPANRRVLLVEDDHANRYAMGHMLKAAGFEVAEASAAAEAVRMLTPAPSCVLLDWLIPGGGDAVLRHVRDNDLPTGVVVVTVAHEERREEIAALGPDASLPKPFTSADLLAALRACARG